MRDFSTLGEPPHPILCVALFCLRSLSELWVVCARVHVSISVSVRVLVLAGMVDGGGRYVQDRGEVGYL